jgi:hypothetical protein
VREKRRLAGLADSWSVAEEAVVVKRRATAVLRVPLVPLLVAEAVVVPAKLEAAGAEEVEWPMAPRESVVCHPWGQSSEWDVTVLASRQFLTLRRQHSQASHELSASLGRVDDVVYVSPFGSRVRRREALGVLIDEFRSSSDRVGRLL